jgi:hypothetical protein
MLSSNLLSKHESELLTQSGIDRDLALLNFRSIAGNIIYDRLLISAELSRNNSGKISQSWLKRYQHCINGGWWCHGLDPMDNWSEMEWGTFKPDRPTKNAEKKLIKYEHPPQLSTRLFCLQVTVTVWQLTAKLFKVPFPEQIEVGAAGNAIGYWQWIIDRRIPIVLCEGAKKAAALLSHGYPAIALPGINSGYRTVRDLYGNQIGRNLIPELSIFSRNRQPIAICFDYETVSHKIKLVDTAIAHLGELFQQEKCPVKVIRLPGPEKGVDDAIVSQGIDTFHQIYQTSLDLEIDLARSRRLTELTYPADRSLNCRYLHSLDIPSSGIVGIKAPKGTGKTTALIPIVEAARAENRPILLLTHRIQLGKFLCQRIGVNWIDRERTIQGDRSLGLCFDSVWKLNPQDWTGGIIILDEVEQSLWHLLHSATCRKKRLAILKIFQQAVAQVLATGGLVIAQDADLSDISIDYLCKLARTDIKPWIAIDRWQPERGWDVCFYDTPNPTALIDRLEQDLAAGLKCYVTTDSRTGKYGSETLDRYIKQALERLGDRYTKTLVVCSHTTSTIGHAAVDFVAEIDDRVSQYDAVFVTPTVGTGVSIDVKHFDRVYGIFQGVIPDAEARQALARVRASVPRHVWCAKRGIGKIASGSNNYRALAYWYQENFKENYALMCPTANFDIDLPFIYDPIHLRAWAKYAARVNASIVLYQEAIIAGLISEGHQLEIVNNIVDRDRLKELRMALIQSAKVDPQKAREIMGEIAAIHKQQHQRDRQQQSIADRTKNIHRSAKLKYAEAIAKAPDLTPHAYRYLTNKRFLSEAERAQLEKYQLQQRYGVKVTPALKLKDDKGYYGQLITHFYLMYRDRYLDRKIQFNLEGNFQFKSKESFLPDTDRYLLKIQGLLALGIHNFIDPDRQFHLDDPDLVALKHNSYLCEQHIHRTIGIKLPLLTAKREPNSIDILNRFLDLLGLKVKLLSSSATVYQLDRSLLEDGRNQIFDLWDSQQQIELPICS